MKRSLILFALLTATLAHAGDPKTIAPDASITPPPVESPDVPVSQEFQLDGSYTGEATTKQGNADVGGTDNIHGHFNYVASPQIHEGVLLRLGVDAERDSFGLPESSPLPNTLQSVNAIIGTDITLNDHILLRAELHPGIYSDFVRVTGSDFDMPFLLGGTYLWNKDFQIIVGLQVDLKSSLPVIPGVGFRWQFADQWVLSLIPPRPQLQYEITRSVTLYTGAEIIGGTYHLNENFGDNHGHGDRPGTANFDGNIIDFAEIRVGVGVKWKFLPNVSLDVSGGYMPYRSFDIHPDKIGFDRNTTLFHNNLSHGAPYGEIGLSGSF